MVEAVFWGAVAFVIYTYAGYPACLWGLSKIRPRQVRRAAVPVKVSLIITAHNERARIRAKLENALDQDYPTELVEVIVASDASSDGTDDIVREFGNGRVRLVRSDDRKGKEHAQKAAIEAAGGEILVFSDVGATAGRDVVSKFVRNFADPSVACVSGVDVAVAHDGCLDGEGLYVRYEMFVRRLESAVGTLIGLSGSLFAVRRSLCHSWRSDVPGDFQVALNTIRANYRCIEDRECLGYYRNVALGRREFERKVRTVVRGLATLMTNVGLWNPLRHGMAAWQLLSHKLCRWLVPFAMIMLFLTSLVLSPDIALYRAALAGQFVFYGIAVATILRPGLSRATVVRAISFFVLTNVAILVAWTRYINGERIVMWQPSAR